MKAPIETVRGDGVDWMSGWFVDTERKDKIHWWSALRWCDANDVAYCHWMARSNDMLRDRDLLAYIGFHSEEEALLFYLRFK